MNLMELGQISLTNWSVKKLVITIGKGPVELIVVKTAAELNLSLSTNGTYWFLQKT